MTDSCFMLSFMNATFADDKISEQIDSIFLKNISFNIINNMIFYHNITQAEVK